MAVGSQPEEYHLRERFPKPLNVVVNPLLQLFLIVIFVTGLDELLKKLFQFRDFRAVGVDLPGNVVHLV